MVNKSWRVAQCAAVMAIAILFGSGAEAGFVRGGFDPPGNGIVPGYSGNALFNVDDSCFQTGFTGYEKPTIDCGPASLVSGQVLLFGLNEDPLTGTQVDSFALPPGSLTVTGLRFVDGMVQGIDTSFGGVFHGSSVYSGYDFYLQFLTGCLGPGGDENPYVNCGAPPEIVGLDVVSQLNQVQIDQNLQKAVLTRRICDIELDGCSNFSLATEPGRLQFTPEPGTLALMFGALGGGWLARRRRTKAAA